MKLILILSVLMITAVPLYQFDSKSTDDWQIVDDRVMGGQSYGKFKVNDSGHGLFYGDVSTDNNGGFSSLRASAKSEDLSDNKAFILKVKGDGKRYQFRVKTSLSIRHSYIMSFTTNGEWQEIKIPFNKMFASWRGRTLDMPNYDGAAIEEMRFLIGNKKNESFQLEMDWIKVK
ncbi:CIA30 family protein [Vicingaceae bacterium]|nr:CIA30 family protein [Vicingaceae bacterium]